MVMKKRLLLSAAAFYLLSGTAAIAQMDVQVNFGTPAYVVAPAPVYMSPYPSYYDPQHRHHDYQYWRERKERERHDHDRHDEHGHHDHDEHYEHDYR